MNKNNCLVILMIIFLLAACATRKKMMERKTVQFSKEANAGSSVAVKRTNDTIASVNPVEWEDRSDHKSNISDTTFVNLRDYSADFVYKMKYATSDNFLKTKVYDCPECYLRYKTVKALIKANEKFLKKGFRIVLYDCYRPLSVQKKMWELVPNPEYVADPKKGSIHNRGGAVDIGLADLEGKELDMGTPFDYFGIEASHEFEGFSDEIKSNRKLLRKVMTQSDFRIFESEWWHYNLKNAQKNPLSDFKWKCD